ncbi:Pleiotropic drug resistance protein 2 [Zea mays]|uniref:Pleiotropic drug resistance protein 2 n=1 Tax=Zea mays TaxID=4577 RepID=A0A1D6I1A7_MAIZE|nr:Pleiotropic drug resistance protein 2 [Zea mays]
MALMLSMTEIRFSVSSENGKNYRDSVIPMRDSKQWSRLGCQDPEVEIIFDSVSVEAVVPVGRRTTPTLPNTIINCGKAVMDSVLMRRSREETFKIIDAVSGTIRSSRCFSCVARMTLLLGAPGSGKTTLLKALAGKLDSSLKIHGDVKYKCNGETMSSTSQHLCAYVSQNDLHHPEMTVRETINFASNMLGANNEFGRGDILT